MEQAAAFERQVNELVDRVGARWPDVEIIVSSPARHIARASTAAQVEIKLFSTVAVVGILILFVVAFRAVSPLLFTVSSIGFGCVVGIAAVAASFGQVHLIALVFGCSLIGVGVDYALHFVCMGTPQQVNRLRGASLLALASTSAAYALIVQAEIPVVAQIAVLSCAGLAGSWLFVAAAHPWWMGDATLVRGRLLQRWATGLQHLYQRSGRRRVLLLWGLIGAIACGTIVGCANFDNSVRGLYAPDAQLLEQDRRAAELLGRASATQYVLVSGESVDELLANLAGDHRRVA